jgi:lantibiotic modifying enzyme
MNWYPILKDNVEAHNKIEEIYLTLKKNSSYNYDLMGGSLGMAIFLLYYETFIKNMGNENNGINTLENTFELVNKGSTSLKFAGGLSGFVWGVNHLANEGIIKTSGMGLNLLKPLLIKEMLLEIKEGNYDFLHGAVGIAFCLLKYIKSKSTIESLDKFLEILLSNGIKEKNTIKWLSSAVHNQSINGVNFGLSHGLASIIGVLLSFIKANVSVSVCISTINQTINYILKYKNKSQSLSVFPDFVTENLPVIYNGRLAWCYGDLGVAYTLWRASEVLKREDVKIYAEKVLLETTQRRNLAQNSIVDAGLCHGAAGVAHIYNRMYNHTKIEIFKETSLYWFKQTLKMANHYDGLAGFKVWRPIDLGGIQNDPSLLEGVAGIGLALISAVYGIEPKWDECLLLS